MYRRAWWDEAGQCAAGLAEGVQAAAGGCASVNKPQDEAAQPGSDPRSQ